MENISLFRTLCSLADISYMLGAIDASEHLERLEVARWIVEDDSALDDPRGPAEEPDEPRFEELKGESAVQVSSSGNPEEPGWLEFVAFRKWYFTRSDPDPYPSTPHGHLQSANRAWPKLNPYTGRVFIAKHREDVLLRLTRSELRQLWATEAFRDFCRSHIMWYAEQHPHHEFGVLHPLRFPRW
ncbi:hypothetical protein DY931_13800 [Pseudomonas aeruginosa]|uniref:hypothetical protein n=1 Tax=Pseudomonas aeruginosa TaxID=287 RepID=UPI000F82D51C|nr:hypothetical protein [Pseudomonas aeruginosa]RTR61060.1 hypothetical protein DY931_13800 [Pseudomonas aeruginosa]